jgi:hypothetical protein
MSLFEIKRRSPHDNISIELDFASVRGKAIMRDTTTPTKGALAAGVFLGFLTRDVVDGGPTAIERAGVYPGRLEQDDDFGQVTLELADAVEAEGSDYVLTSGTGALSSGTAIGTLLSFVDGKFYVAQGSDEKPFRLGKVLTEEVSGNLRIYAERVA